MSFYVCGMFALCWLWCTLVYSPAAVHVFGVQTLQWQGLFSPVQKKVVQSGGEGRVAVVVGLIRLRLFWCSTHSCENVSWCLDHSHVWQQGSRDPLHWLGASNDSKCHRAQRVPPCFTPKLHRHPTTSQLIPCWCFYGSMTLFAYVTLYAVDSDYQMSTGWTRSSRGTLESRGCPVGEGGCPGGWRL